MVVAASGQLEFADAFLMDCTEKYVKKQFSNKTFKLVKTLV